MNELLQYVPVAVWLTVIAGFGKVIHKFGRQEEKLDVVDGRSVKNSEKLDSLGDRVSSMEGQLKRINGRT